VIQYLQQSFKAKFMKEFQPTGNKAPKGGAVSAYTGKFYEGGQFMPESALPANKRKVKAIANRYEAHNVTLIKVYKSHPHPWDTFVNYSADVSVRGVDNPKTHFALNQAEAQFLVSQIQSKFNAYWESSRFDPISPLEIESNLD